MGIESFLNIHIRENHDINTNNLLQSFPVTLLLGPLSTWSNSHLTKIIDADCSKYSKFANCLCFLFDDKLVRGLGRKEAWSDQGL